MPGKRRLLLVLIVVIGRLRVKIIIRLHQERGRSPKGADLLLTPPSDNPFLPQRRQRRRVQPEPLAQHGVRVLPEQRRGDAIVGGGFG